MDYLVVISISQFFFKKKKGKKKEKALKTLPIGSFSYFFDVFGVKRLH